MTDETYWPVVRENIFTGSIGHYTHALRRGEKETICGQSIYIEQPSVQFSVEPDETFVNCPKCRNGLNES